MKRVTNQMVAEALLASYKDKPVSPDYVTGNDLDDAYADAREAAGNPVPLVSIRSRGNGPKSCRLDESRHDAVLAIYAALLKSPC